MGNVRVLRVRLPVRPACRTLLFLEPVKEALEYPLSSKGRGPCWQGDSRDHCIHLEHHPQPSMLSQSIPHHQPQRLLAK